MGNQFQWQLFGSFAGGLNTAQSPTKIADDEVASILNLQFELNDVLKSRGGFTRYNISPDFTSRITSLFQFFKSDGTNILIATSGSELYKDDGIGNFSSIKGGLTLPTNTLWQWKMFTDLAIGVNRGIGGPTSIIKWTGAGNAAALALTGISGAPDGAKFIEVFNQRLWLVFSSNPNRLYFSELGAPETWNGTGGFIEVGFNDGDKITGIFGHRGVLFIFKQNRIYRLNTSVGGKINTDPTGWELKDHTKSYGCMSGLAVGEILDDLVFPSHEGLVSIEAVQDFGDFKSTILSRKIKELSNLNFNLDSFVAVVDTSKSVYLLSVPKTSAGTINNRIYVLDYKKINPDVIKSYLFDSVRWTIFESSIINPSALCLSLISGKKTIFLGGDSPLFYICKWDDGVYNDTSQLIEKSFKSKSYNFGTLFERKEFNQVGINLSFTKKDLSSTLEFILDEKSNLKDTFNISKVNEAVTSLWDSALWDSSFFAADTTNTQIFTRRTANFSRGISGQLSFTNTQLDQDIAISDIGFEIGKLTQEEA